MSASLGARLRRLDAALDATGSVRAVALLRFAIAPLVFIHLRPFRDLMDRDTWYQDRFHESWVSWYPEVGKGTYFWLLRYRVRGWNGGAARRSFRAAPDRGAACKAEANATNALPAVCTPLGILAALV